MANKHFGNLADVFKHLTLAECLATSRPGEYWESHAGRAVYDETDEVPFERAHGIHTFWRLSDGSEMLRQSAYARVLKKLNPPHPPTAPARLQRIPGSALLARQIWGREARRYLLCDTDADSLLNIQRELPAAGGSGEIAADTLECVQEDGITVLRGAGVLLPEAWTGSVVAFLDPYDLEAPSDAGISALQLACELANRSIKVLAFFGFDDEGTRNRRHDAIRRELGRTRPASASGGTHQWFEGALRTEAAAGPCPTQWGFGMLALNIPTGTLATIDGRLRACEAAYAGAPLDSGTNGAWRYTRSAV
jgi:hypothetical protein